MIPRYRTGDARPQVQTAKPSVGNVDAVRDRAAHQGQRKRHGLVGEIKQAGNARPFDAGAAGMDQARGDGVGASATPAAAPGWSAPAPRSRRGAGSLDGSSGSSLRLRPNRSRGWARCAPARPRLDSAGRTSRAPSAPSTSDLLGSAARAAYAGGRGDQSERQRLGRYGAFTRLMRESTGPARRRPWRCARSRSQTKRQADQVIQADSAGAGKSQPYVMTTRRAARPVRRNRQGRRRFLSFTLTIATIMLMTIATDTKRVASPAIVNAPPRHSVQADSAALNAG